MSKYSNVHSSDSIVLEIWRKSLASIDPAELLARCRRLPRRFGPEEAILCWGKATHRFRAALKPRIGAQTPFLSISPIEKPRGDLAWVTGEHPLPGRGSFEAGARLLEFFDSLRPAGVRTLHVFLSGGASSLAWLKPSRLPEAELRAKLEDLYREPIDIAELNRRRSALCLLKNGGAGKWLKNLAPRSSCKVWLISDVAPYGPEVVGSGPFAGAGPHVTLADNATWIDCIRSVIEGARDESVLSARASCLEDWKSWRKDLVAEARAALSRGRRGWILRGGEPMMQVRHSTLDGRGGRMTHLAAALALDLERELERGDLEILCVASDGVDGTSGAAGAHLDRAVGARLPRARARTRKALAEFDSASALSDLGALISVGERGAYSGTNVQDAVLIRVRPSSSSRTRSSRGSTDRR